MVEMNSGSSESIQSMAKTLTARAWKIRPRAHFLASPLLTPPSWARPERHPDKNNPDRSAACKTGQEEWDVEIGELLAHRFGQRRIGADPREYQIEPRQQRQKENQRQRQGRRHGEQRLADSFAPAAARQTVHQQHRQRAERQADYEHGRRQPGAGHVAGVER